MKAQVLYDIDKLLYEEVPMPEPAESEVLVKVRAAGICGSDIPRIFRTGAHKMPLVPGHEFSGEVVKIYGKQDEKWLNRRVGIFPLIPCKKCEMCKSGHFELCRNYDYIGSRRDGAFAEYVSVPAENLLMLPEGVSFEQAAMLEPMAVAVHAMRRISFDKSMPVAVFGLGTIGTLLAMFLLEAGCQNLYVIGNKEAQKKQVEALGLPVADYCDSRKVCVGDWIMQKTGNGAAAVFECVGTNEAYAEAIRLAAPMGRVVLVGNPAKDMQLSQNDYWKILRNQLTVTGTWNSAFGEGTEDDWGYVVERLKTGRIHPEMLITHRFSLQDMDKGLRIMRDKTESYCKIMVTMG